MGPKLQTPDTPPKPLSPVTGVAALFTGNEEDFRAEMERRGELELYDGNVKGMPNPEIYRDAVRERIFLNKQGYRPEMIDSGIAHKHWSAKQEIDVTDAGEFKRYMSSRAKIDHAHDNIVAEYANIGHRMAMHDPDDAGYKKWTTVRDEGLENLEDPEIRAMALRGFNYGFKQGQAATPPDIRKHARNTVTWLRAQGGEGAEGVEPPSEEGKSIFSHGEDFNKAVEWYMNAPEEDKRKWRAATMSLMTGEENMPALKFYSPEKLRRALGMFFSNVAATATEGLADDAFLPEAAKAPFKRTNAHARFEGEMWEMLKTTRPLYDVETAGVVRQGFESGIESLPGFAAAYFMGPAGMAMMGAHESGAVLSELRKKYPDADDRRLRAIANNVGILNGMIEGAQVKMLKGFMTQKMPGLDKFLTGLKGGPLRATLAKAGLKGAALRTSLDGIRLTAMMGGEFLEESLQDVSQPFFTQFEKALGTDFPGFSFVEELDKIKKNSAIRFWAVAPMVLLGGGGSVIRERVDGRRAAFMFENRREMAASGVTLDDIAKVRAMSKAGDPEGALLDFQEAYESYTEEEHEQNRDEAMGEVAREDAMEGDTVRAVERSDGSIDIFTPDGNKRNVRSMEEGAEVIAEYEAGTDTKRMALHKELIDFFTGKHADQSYQYKESQLMSQAVERGEMDPTAAQERARLVETQLGNVVEPGTELDLSQYVLKGQTTTEWKGEVSRIAVKLSRQAKPEQVIEEAVEGYF